MTEVLQTRARRADHGGPARAARGARPARRARHIGMIVAGMAMIATLLLGSPGMLTPSQAIVSDLPTWADVEAAKKNEAATAAKITQIEGLLAAVQQEVAETQAALTAATTAQIEAEEAYDEARMRAEALSAKAEESAKEADEASKQAAALVAQLYRSGGVDRNVALFLEADASAADQLLARLAQVEKATERNTAVADAASLAQNNATSLAKAAKAASDERDRLLQEATARKEEAGRAASAAADKLAEQEKQKAQLDAQLAALKDTTASTTAGYEQRLQLEAEERARLEEEARRAAEAGGGGGGGQVAGNWRIPLNSYYVSDWWGAGRAHTGVDLAAPLGTPIYAAASGTVTMSGWYSPCYGNVVEISHGGGVATRYAHQRQTPIVRYGQWVNMGEIIGYVGSTGCSLGPHLHFEVYTNGYPIDPAPFFAARGLWF